MATGSHEPSKRISTTSIIPRLTNFHLAILRFILENDYKDWALS